MKAKQANLLELLKGGTQFVVPIYQRLYSWEQAECERLWSDIVTSGAGSNSGEHFTGSIVYVESEQGSRTDVAPDLIIDGQQRVTTTMLLLAALAAHLEALPEDERRPVAGFSPDVIRESYLVNRHEQGDAYYKLLLSQSDREALKAVVRGAATPAGSASRVTVNHQFFVDKLAAKSTDLVAVCLGLRKLSVVDVALTRGVDDPQLVFETMNSTGRKLSQADLIRNYVLMGQPIEEQTRLYEDYWYPMEQRFAGPRAERFDTFIRAYLTYQLGREPVIAETYEEFKRFAGQDGESRAKVVVDLARHAEWFEAFALGREADPVLGAATRELESVNVTVAYPFLLRLYADRAVGLVDSVGIARLVRTVISYVVRRNICDIPTNALNKIFRGLKAAGDGPGYVESIEARLITYSGTGAFPTDEEVLEALARRDLYHFRRSHYVLTALENFGHDKEPTATAGYTIEHIMPQNPNLLPEWQMMLGPDWQEIQERLLHTLGNLTLTGYNPEYQDKPFLEKRDMKDGFRDSSIRLNAELRDLDAWTEDTIVARGKKLAARALEVWTRPALDDATLDRYRKQFADSRGFNWSGVHDILERFPTGHWTGYYYLAEAVGTSAQAVANHLMSCTTCTAAYRVLTWDGRVSPGFKWGDPRDSRDPIEVLRAEGVRFFGSVADPVQKLGTDELLELIGDVE